MLPQAFPFFLFQILENEIFKFEEQICDFEEEDLSNIPDEEVRDSILAAVGKAKLLMSQKLTQFRGLCDKNIVSAFLDLPISSGYIWRPRYPKSRLFVQKLTKLYLEYLRQKCAKILNSLIYCY